MTRPSARSPSSAPYTSGTRNPPPPRMVSFMLITSAASLRERGEGRRVCGRVGHYYVEVRRTAHLGHPLAGELPGVGEQHHLLGGGHHGPLHRHLDHGGVHDLSAGSDAARSQEQPVGVQLAQAVLGEEAHQRAVLAADHTAGEHQLDAGVLGQLLVHHQIACDHGESAAVQLPGQAVGGGADVQQHRLAVLDHCRGALRQDVLVGDPDLGDLRERLITLLHHRAPVDAGEKAVLLQPDQVAADRGGAHVQLGGEIGHRGGPPGAQCPQDELMSSLCQHAVHTTLQFHSIPCLILKKS